MGGLDFLRWLNMRPEPWGRVPVVIFTANDDPAVAAVAAEGYALGAREVKVTPTDFTELVDLVAGILQRWLPHIA
jgi:CheY-like chemotaxis protein